MVELILVDLHYGAGDFLLSQRTITHYHDFVQLGYVFLQCDVHAVLCLHLLRYEAYIGDDQCGARLTLNLKITVKVGDGAALSPLHNDAGSDDVFAGIVLHMTTNGGLC